MNPAARKYKQFIDFHQEFENACKNFETDLRAFTNDVEKFQKSIDVWVNGNSEIIKQAQFTENTHLTSVVEIINKGTELSEAMIRLGQLEITYSNAWSLFAKKLKEMSSNKSPEILIADLPKLKDFSKRNHRQLNGMITELKKEINVADSIYKDLKAAYNKQLN